MGKICSKRGAWGRSCVPFWSFLLAKFACKALALHLAGKLLGAWCSVQLSHQGLTSLIISRSFIDSDDTAALIRLESGWPQQASPSFGWSTSSVLSLPPSSASYSHSTNMYPTCHPIHSYHTPQPHSHAPHIAHAAAQATSFIPHSSSPASPATMWFLIAKTTSSITFCDDKKCLFLCTTDEFYTTWSRPDLWAFFKKKRLACASRLETGFFKLWRLLLRDIMEMREINGREALQIRIKPTRCYICGQYRRTSSFESV